MSPSPLGHQPAPTDPIGTPLRVAGRRFVWKHVLGAGGGGPVWLALDVTRNALVAVKIVGGGAARRAAMERLRARLALLDDPHVLRVDEIIAAGEDTWLVMEYAAGGDASRLRGAPWPQVVRALLPIARALAQLHRHEIVHRDVKATNVVFMADGTPRLTDFETALRIGEVADASTAPGSRYSMSPQALNGEPASIADDVYGFGALLYELSSGYPPFYPNAAPERIRHEVPHGIEAHLPAELQALIARCLRKAPSERPGSMEAIEAQLECVLKQERACATGDARSEQVMSTNEPHNGPLRGEVPQIRPPSTPAQPLRSEWRRSTPRTQRTPERALAQRRVRKLLAIAVAALALFGVFFLLPKWVQTEQHAIKRPAVTKPAAAEPAVAAKPEPVDFAALARAKQQADELREPLLERLDQLRTRAVEQWAADELAKAEQTLAEGDARYAERAYIDALAHFTRLEPQLEALEARATRVLEEQLAAGAQALAEGRSQEARAAFELALKIEPKHAAAERGLARAGTLDRVLALLRSAQDAEREGNLERALADYRQAVELDKDMTQAAEGVARVQARQAGDAFASAMARGFAALGSNDYAAARRAFEAAGAIRPNTAEVAAALEQVRQSERTRSIADKLDAARAAEARERWAEAQRTYQEILSLDPTVAAANEGLARVQPRAELNEQLELYLTQPERLFSAPVRAAAYETLARAGAITPPGPLLSQQMAKLREWLARADVPVAVALQSDNLTQVTIHRVGSLGTFEQRSLELLPGEYTVVGTRPGYRDVRRQIRVVPGASLPPIVIRCEEEI